MKIKVCGMRETENISELLELEPDFIGFIFYEKSKRFAGETDVDFASSISNGPEKVGVFVNSDYEQILERAEVFGLKYLQLHGSESPELCKKLQEEGYKIIKVFQVAESLPKNLKDYKTCADYFLFDTKSDQFGGTGKKFDWSILKNYDNEVPLILSGGVDVESIEEIKKLASELNIFAVDINSKFELRPGLKDINKIKKFKSLLES